MACSSRVASRQTTQVSSIPADRWLTSARSGPVRLWSLGKLELVTYTTYRVVSISMLVRQGGGGACMPRDGWGFNMH